MTTDDNVGPDIILRKRTEKKKLGRDVGLKLIHLKITTMI